MGRRLNVPAESKTSEQPTGHFGWFTPFVSMDMRASSRRTQSLLGWQAAQRGLIADIEEGRYFSR